jgi:hypothetical protein
MPKWDAKKLVKSIDNLSCVANNKNGYINEYEKQEAYKDLQLYLANFD